MKTLETRLPAGEIIDIKKLPDGTWIIKQKLLEEDKVKEITKVSSKGISGVIFRRIDAESLSKKDKFMRHKPKTKSEKMTKDGIIEAIEKGVKNFYRPVIDPSFSDNGGIVYERGMMPAVGKSYNWWVDTAKMYDPERKSRIGTRLEYFAFLGVLLKNLVAYGAEVSWAWNAVCNDSKEIGHYWNSEDAKHKVEPTGSRDICGFYDLSNTYKMLAEDEDTGGHWVVGGNFGSMGYANAISEFYHYNYTDVNNSLAVGWIVFS